MRVIDRQIRGEPIIKINNPSFKNMLFITQITAYSNHVIRLILFTMS